MDHAAGATSDAFVRPSQPPLPPSRVMCLLMLLGLGMLVRVHDLGHSLWLDELNTTWILDATTGTRTDRVRVSNQVTPYFALLDSVVAVAGESERMLRAP